MIVEQRRVYLPQLCISRAGKGLSASVVVTAVIVEQRRVYLPQSWSRQ